MAVASTLPGPNSKFKTCYKPFRSWQPIHNNGQAALAGGADILFSTLDQSVVITHLNSGKKLQTIEADSSSVTSICCTTTCPKLQPTILFLIAFRSLAIRIYALHRPTDSQPLGKLELVKTTSRAHEAPISTSRSDPTASVFATGDTAGVVRIWDARAGHCTHVFKGHGGIVSALCFDIDLKVNRTRLAVGSGDCRIKLWDLSNKNLIGLFEGAHLSIIRGLEISPDGLKMISGSRDKVLNVWSLSNSDNPGQILKTIPIYESIESIGLIHPTSSESSLSKPKSKDKLNSKKKRKIDNPLMVYTAGDKGIIRIWDLESGNSINSEIDLSNEPDILRASIFDARLDPITNTLLVNKIDQSFSFFNIPSLQLVRQVVGSHDEIIDISLLKSSPLADNPSHLVVATNSPLVRILEIDENKNDCRMLSGHSDIVLCLAKSQDQSWFVSGSKDKTARIWKMIQNNKSGASTVNMDWRCVGICEGHVQSLGALSLAEFVGIDGKPITLLATASQDRTVKLWDLSLLSTQNNQGIEQHLMPQKLKSLMTMQIHDKDINSTDFSADCKLFGSGSQDRLAKIFSLDHSSSMGTTLKLMVTLKGHKRGVWSIKFSHHDKFVLTGSGDCTIRLWSTDNRNVNKESQSSGFGSCLKTFEGHSNAILRLNFLDNGQQIVSTSSDCLVKIWDIKTQICVVTLGDESEEGDFEFQNNTRTDAMNHDGKIWGLDVVDEAGSRLITAGADSKIIFWKDETEALEQNRLKAKVAEIELNQDVENYIQLKEYGVVINLLIKLDKPVKLLRLLTDLASNEKSDEFGNQEIDSITGSTKVDEAIENLPSGQLLKLLEYVRNWNSMTKTADIGQRVLHAIVKTRTSDEILECLSKTEAFELSLPDEINGNGEIDENESSQKKVMNNKLKLKQILDSLLPYTERHLIRVEKFVQEASVVQYLLNQMGEC
ncbi:hypothetical protein O181_066373 [Austropuccinia psidii MF-1]|uniref:U3 small nucleolar RNA-associated protein 13 C-terminal domain-containing protein n=1 Tax=Austropuccinia psidii MF-1 TaxID=1389203 RepID=A0A9Q3I3J6_9BASI|nr:hypothetical protein [Austropuccinia psidii MF-1]